MSHVYECLCCQKPCPEYEPIFCCSGYECGCHGQPCEPCACSVECWNAIIDLDGTMEDRRIQAGIELYKEDEV